MTFCIAPYKHKQQGRFSFIQNGVVSKILWWFKTLKLNLPVHFNLELSNVALSHMLPCFPTFKLSSPHLVIFKHPYLTHTKSNSRNILRNEFSMSFFSHLSFGFPLKVKKLPSKSEKIQWNNKFLKLPPCRN
jgi:hypothetical protein